MPIVIEHLGIDNADRVLEMVLALLKELGEEGDDLGPLDRGRVLAGWEKKGEAFRALVARETGGAPVGVATVVESFAIYANGTYGVINEMYVAPSHRSAGVGHQLIQAAKGMGRDRGWKRIEVTAPESPRWARTRAFYEREGFTFAGPKLKLPLP